MGPDVLGDERLSQIKARWASARGKDMSAWYILDVGDMLDEIDRLRYEATRKSAKSKKKVTKRSTSRRKKAGKKNASRSP
jgi:hypothetical protein